MTLVTCLVRHFRETPARAAELIALGAVYNNGERVEKDAPVAPGDHLQVYLSPVRFPVGGIDWPSTIVEESDDFLVVSKPAGVPVHATADNLQDNLLFCLRAATGKTLLITQRLDTPVAGLVVLAKTPTFQRHFNRLLAESKVEKRYRALTVKTVAPGSYTHYLEPSEKAPRSISAEEKKGWLRAEISVLSARTVHLPVSPRPFVDIEVRLRTGRTHQIRAQLGKLGAPIVGDKLYGSTVRYSKLKYGRGIALFSASIAWESRAPLTLAPPWEGP